MKFIFHIQPRNAYVVAENVDQLKTLCPELLTEGVTPVRVSSEKVTVFNWKTDEWEIGLCYNDGVKSMRSLNAVVKVATGVGVTVREVIEAVLKANPKQAYNGESTCFHPIQFIDHGCAQCPYHKFCVCQATLRHRLRSSFPSLSGQYAENAFIGAVPQQAVTPEQDT